MASFVWMLLSIIARDRLSRAVSKDDVCLKSSRYSMQHAFPLRLLEFLGGLFQNVKEKMVDVENACCEDQPAVGKGFEGAYCNFNHYITTNSPLSEHTLDDLLHQLFASHAALFFPLPRQPWDVMIPIYMPAPIVVNKESPPSVESQHAANTLRTLISMKCTIPPTPPCYWSTYETPPETTAKRISTSNQTT